MARYGEVRIENPLDKMKRLIVILAVLIPTLSFGKGLGLQPSFSHLSTDEGLSSPTVNDICIDDRGVVWIATRDGLNRFDGKYVSVFRPNSASEESGVGSIIGHAVYDGRDRFFLVLPDYLSIFDRKSCTFRNIPCKNLGDIALGNGLYVSRNNIIGRFIEEDGSFDPVFLLKDGLSVSDLTFQGDKLWIGTKQDGLYLSDAGGEPFKVLDTGKIADIYCDSKGFVWVSTWTRGLFRLGPGDEVVNYRNSSSDKNTISSDFVRTCCEDGEGNIWVGSIKGIDRIDARTGRLTRVRSNTGTRDALSNNSIWKLCRDRQGNIWVATYYGGVNYFNPEVDLFTCYYPSPYHNEGLSNPIVGRIYGDGDDGLWITTEAGFNHFDRKTGKFSWYGITPDGDATLEHVKALWHDKSKGMVWVGADMGGLFRVNLDSGDIKAYYHDPDNPFTIPGNRVRDVIPYKNDSLVVATQSGICVFSTASGKCRRILSNYNGVDVVTDVSFGPDGFLWIVDSEGIYRYEMESGKVFSYSGEDSPGKFVSCTFFDSDGGIWVGTYDSGVFGYNAVTDSFRHIPLSSLSTPCINSIGEIPSTGDLIFSTSSGFCVFEPVSGDVRIYDAKSGYPFRSTSENSLFVSRDGTVFLGGNQGMVSFDSEDIYRTPRRFDIVPVRVSVNGKAVGFSEDSGAITVKRGASVSIEISTTNYVPSDIVNLEYNLSSGSNGWTAVGADGVVVVPDIKVGKVILTVRDGDAPEEICPALVIRIYSGVRLSAVLSFGVLALLAVLGLIFIYRRRRLSLRKDDEEEDLSPARLLCRKAERIVEANIGNPDFDITAFSSEMGMSRTVLFQKIKEATGRTPNDFIMGIRLERAAGMLEKSMELNVSDIAEKVGFGSAAYFSQKFKEVYDVSPMAYRKRFTGK